MGGVNGEILECGGVGGVNGEIIIMLIHVCQLYSLYSPNLSYHIYVKNIYVHT